MVRITNDVTFTVLLPLTFQKYDFTIKKKAFKSKMFKKKRQRTTLVSFVRELCGVILRKGYTLHTSLQACQFCKVNVVIVWYRTCI